MAADVGLMPLHDRQRGERSRGDVPMPLRRLQNDVANHQRVAVLTRADARETDDTARLDPDRIKDIEHERLSAAQLRGRHPEPSRRLVVAVPIAGRTLLHELEGTRL